jgi:HPt (histidine-containing phosphotransfer) domain-containing protein
MIDRQKFDETFQYFDKDVILDIIAIYEEELPGRLEKIYGNIRDKDFENLAFNAHSLKSVTGAFMDPNPTELARIIEEQAINLIDQDLEILYEKLKSTSEDLARELAEIKQTL